MSLDRKCESEFRRVLWSGKVKVGLQWGGYGLRFSISHSKALQSATTIFSQDLRHFHTYGLGRPAVWCRLGLDFSVFSGLDWVVSTVPKYYMLWELY